jgi:hypothetical protein
MSVAVPSIKKNRHRPMFFFFIFFRPAGQRFNLAQVIGSTRVRLCTQSRVHPICANVGRGAFSLFSTIVLDHQLSSATGRAALLDAAPARRCPGGPRRAPARPALPPLGPRSGLLRPRERAPARPPGAPARPGPGPAPRARPRSSSPSSAGGYPRQGKRGVPGWSSRLRGSPGPCRYACQGLTLHRARRAPGGPLGAPARPVTPASPRAFHGPGQK